MAKKTAINPATEQSMGRDELMQMLGAARYAEWLNGQTASHLMQFLITVEDEKLYKLADYPDFETFLNASGLKGRSTYYNHRKLFLKEGSEQYDLFEDLGVPARVRNLLTSGDVVIKGDEVIIGGEQTISLANSVGVKKLVEQLVKDKIAAQDSTATANNKLFREEHKRKAVESERALLQGEIDAIEEGTPFEQAYLRFHRRLLILKNEIEMLDPDEREERAEGDMEEFGRMFNEIAEAYGVADWQIKERKILEKQAAAGGENQ